MPQQPSPGQPVHRDPYTYTLAAAGALASAGPQETVTTAPGRIDAGTVEVADTQKKGQQHRERRCGFEVYEQALGEDAGQCAHRLASAHEQGGDVLGQRQDLEQRVRLTTAGGGVNGDPRRPLTSR